MRNIRIDFGTYTNTQTLFTLKYSLYVIKIINCINMMKGMAVEIHKLIKYSRSLNIEGPIGQIFPFLVTVSDSEKDNRLLFL